MVYQEQTLLKSEKHSLVVWAGIASLCVSVTLLTLKIYTVYITDSMSILAGLLDSGLDVVASAINFFAIRWAVTPADEDHRFGHGKAEALAGLVQSILITTSSALLMIENVKRFFTPEIVHDIQLGVWVTLFSLVLTVALVTFQKYVIRRSHNLAIKADMMHYQNDVYLNLGILFSLMGTSYFGVGHIDTTSGFIIAGIILYGVKDIVVQSLDQIMDKEFDEEHRERIFHLATSHPYVKRIHDLRTRMAGAESFIQFHLELPPNMPLSQAHIISDEVEFLVLQEFKNAEIFIHLDPLNEPPENPLPYKTVH
jgi:ferrous-iron efflux pump FieF